MHGPSNPGYGATVTATSHPPAKSNTLSDEVLGRARVITDGIDQACARLHALKTRVFGAEPEAAGEAGLNPPFPSGFFPASFEILNRQELGLKALHDLIERFDRQFPER